MSLNVMLSHRFPGHHLDVAFEAGTGVTAVFGPSGAGKTSILRAVSGLLHPDGGIVTLNGRPLTDTSKGLFLPSHRRRIGQVFQTPRLFPHMTVAGNLTYGGGSSRLDEIAHLLDIGDLLDRRPATLSGGEAQRVSLGRALLQQPDAFLLDEPLSALDGRLKAGILPYLDRMKADARVPILYVSHDASEVARLADRVILLKDGKVAANGAFEDIFSDPAHVDLIGVEQMGAALAATVGEHDATDGLSRLNIDGGSLVVPGPVGTTGTRVRVRIKASDVMLSLGQLDGISALNQLNGRVREIRRGTGPGALVVVEIGQARILSRITGRSLDQMGLAVGHPVTAVVKSMSVGRIGLGGH